MTHTLTAPCSYQEDIKKSRFVAYAAPVTTVSEAMQFFAERSDPEATHNCWAYRIGQEYRFNDDGEPGGTAGRPILQAIEGQDMDRVAVLVVRWYGGIKLGAGGLVRAYGGCAANCLRLAQRTEIVDLATVTCACGFAELALLKSRLAQAGAVVQQEDFNEEGVSLRFVVPRSAISDLEVTVANITRGRSAWELLS
ncbi:IMPACT family protein [Achromobacter piechaudii]|uniref:IMPACT family member YigZ n=2 Tax=Achromobacter piechaudii TaxID=72556 RepID=A0ABM8KVY0_9BURK|nr:YigZ family protein [Achromobacter piechaudii]KNY08693.1 thymidylate synthase [Achromobacter piechaudii]CAB3689117.1 IMPACT family member YigZ [Achromobacter piechaudii]CAB3863636.1 IMPACT family member YigZ [Achromobacter piechaudii]CAB3949230.1 IMPACT family member YigZ [Achromobacter piechaudii]